MAINMQGRPPINWKQRAKSAILGALVADAATMPLHWIYDTRMILAILADKAERPEFFDPPSSPFYKADLGGLSPYGDEIVFLLKAMVRSGGLDTTKYSEELHSSYLNHTGYRNKSVQRFLANFEGGKRGSEAGDPADDQADAFVKVCVLVARYAGQPQLSQMVADAVRVQQNNDMAAVYAVSTARVMEQVVMGSTVHEALDWASEDANVDVRIGTLIHAVKPDHHYAYTDYVAKQGQSCHNPGALCNVINAVSRFNDYESAIRANILAGGDNNSRACLIGALMAASGGMEAIPKDWIRQTSNFDMYEQLVDQLLAAA